MTRATLRPATLSLAALLLVPAAQAVAGPVRPPAQPAPSAAVRSRQAAMADFDARMGRLDALMGVRPARGARARSAEAGR